jgi:hypothetical protein
VAAGRAVTGGGVAAGPAARSTRHAPHRRPRRRARGAARGAPIRRGRRRAPRLHRRRARTRQDHARRGVPGGGDGWTRVVPGRPRPLFREPGGGRRRTCRCWKRSRASSDRAAIPCVAR